MINDAKALYKYDVLSLFLNGNEYHNTLYYRLL